MAKDCEKKEVVPCTWPEVGYHVLEELKALSHRLEKLETTTAKISSDVGKIHTQLAMLKVKSGVWGLIAGAIPVFIMLMISFLTSRH